MEDDLVTCPYNKSHRIKKSRFAVHLEKCSRSDTSGKFRICNYNSSHHVKIEEMKEHLLTCPDKIKIEASMFERQLKAASVNMVLEKEPEQPVQYYEEEEDWDKLECATYQPQAAIMNRKVMRNIQNATPSQRREFRKQEAERFKKLEENGEPSKEKQDDSCVRAGARSAVAVNKEALEEFYAKLALK